VEKIALDAGVKKGGAAKGELVLAMYELANCYRNGWGIKKDPVAAKQYYETAANLGDTDAMNEVAWCYVEGFGTKKDKVSIQRELSFVHGGAFLRVLLCMPQLLDRFVYVLYSSVESERSALGVAITRRSCVLLRHHPPLTPLHPASFVGLQYPCKKRG
jgi:hypothetical protein